MTATWRLTDRGKRLYHLYRSFSGIELTPQEFINAICTEQILYGCCLSCGNEYVMLVSLGLYCTSCIRATYERTS